MFLSLRKPLWFVLPLCLVLIACHKEPPKPRIAVVPVGQAPIFWQTVHAGAVAAGQDLGAEILWSGPEMEGDSNRQIAIVNDYVKQGVKGIALAPADPQALVPAVEAVAKLNIPMVIVDSGVRTEKYLTFVSTDNYHGGAAAANRFGDQLPFGASVAIVGGDPGSAATTERESGLREKLAKTYPGIKVVDFQYGMGNDEKSAAVAENIFKTNPGVSGLFCSTVSASLGAVKAAKARGEAGKVKIVGFDVSPALVDELKAGNIDMLIARNPFRIGYIAVWTLLGHMKGHDPERRVEHAGRAHHRREAERTVHPGSPESASRQIPEEAGRHTAGPLAARTRPAPRERPTALTAALSV